MQHSSTAETPHMEANTSVWWDIENSPVTDGSGAHAVLQSIRSAVVKMKFQGEVVISAYGDVSRIPSPVQKALSGAGVALNHVPAGKDLKDAIHNKILVDMLFWAVDNPAPANYLLISNKDFSDILHQLHLRRYNILLAKNISSGKNTYHKTNLEYKQQKDINASGDCGGDIALKKAPHEYFKVAKSRSSYNAQIIPLGKIHQNGSEFSNKRTSTVKSIEQVEGLVGAIMLALDTLREEMVIPNESNIIDCIRCCSPEGYTIVDINKGLHNALKQYKVVNVSLGSFELFVLRGQKIWTCINPIGGNAKDYPEATWNRIRRFLSSSSGRSAIYTSNTRYEAAFILKRECLEELKLGSVLQILNIIVNDKEWIIHHLSGWQPITINIS